MKEKKNKKIRPTRLQGNMGRNVKNLKGNNLPLILYF